VAGGGGGCVYVGWDLELGGRGEAWSLVVGVRLGAWW